MAPRDWLKRGVERLPPGLSEEIRRAYHARKVRRDDFSPGEPELEAALALLERGDWALDVGAYMGHYTIPLARRVGAGGRVIALEPSPENFRILTSNVTAAGCRNVSLLNVAASDGATTLRMLTPSWEDGTLARSRTRVEEEQGVEVLGYPLDRLLSEEMEKLRVVKVDVEGHEKRVLSGMARLLERGRPVVIVEASGKHESPVFEALGYEAVRFADSPNLLYGPPEDCDRLHRLVKVP